jgi:protein tyrosine phosphatase (PTP) superfamily phosphohydrolase (DUF442 family)
MADPDRVTASGLHNVHRLTAYLYTGSSPEGDAGFASLQKLGIKTIITVDGARPDVARAHQFGMRYVHLPIGYDGVPESQALRITKAARDLPGPVYIHCHHGKHRGPAAAAVVHLWLDPKCSVETVVAEMQQAGTDPRYTGLYASPGQLHRPTAAELDQLPAKFPEVAEVAALAQIMVGVDDRWEHLKQVRAAGWQVPADHPDLDPPHEALQLLELYREAIRLPQTMARPEEFRRLLAEAEDAATKLESFLRARKQQGRVDTIAVEQELQRLNATCTRCHATYRDVPQRP